ncbi:hypothetical protein [Paucilactobacillus sp. N302-9]
MDKLTLARLPDKFTAGNLLNNIFQNAEITRKFVAQLYEYDDRVFVEGTISYDPFVKDSSQKLNQNSYVWIIDTLTRLKNMINGIIVTFNDHGIVDVLTGIQTTLVELCLPKRLDLGDEYQQNINQNWQLIEDKLNGCLSYYNSLFAKE